MGNAQSCCSFSDEKERADEIAIATERNNKDLTIDSLFKDNNVPPGCKKVDVKTANGNHYAGYMKDGLREGPGKYTYADGGAFYAGNWEKDKAHGFGVFCEKESRYEGEWMAGEKHGKGEEHWFEDGSIFKGIYVKGFKQGAGKYAWKDGSSYEGQFQNDSIHGNGKFVCSYGVYEGQFEDAFQHGEGVFNYSNGDKYVGQFSRGVREGKGKMVWASGVPHEWYEGQWLEDKPHGIGSLKSLTGFIENGQFGGGEPLGKQ